MKFFSRVVHYFLRTLFACAQFYYYHGGSVCLRQADKKTWRQNLNIFRHLNIFRANFFRASITIGVTPRAKFVHGPRAALEDVQNVCHMSPQLGPPDAKASRRRHGSEQHAMNLLVPSLEKMLQYHAKCLDSASSQTRQISKEPGLGPENPIKDNLLDITWTLNALNSAITSCSKSA